MRNSMLLLWGMLALVLSGMAPSGTALAGPALVFDAKSGAIVHAEDPLAPWFPASLTKLMTVYLAFEAVRDGRLSMDTPLKVSARAAAEPPSKAGLPAGATITLGTALRTVIVRSANDISVVVAEGVAGSLENFVAHMNATARRLGMSGTTFTNPHGLPDHAQVTNARDLGLLAAALIRDFPEHGPLFALQQVRLGKRVITSHNRLLKEYEGADGMKTGFICASGYNLVATATRNGRRLVAVVLGGASGAARNARAAELLERGFESAWWKSIAPRRIADLKPDAVHARPVHMGPVVCKQRYQGAADAYAVDLRLLAARQKAAQANMVPLPTLRPVARPGLILPAAASTASN